ncbi:MAG: serine/threonine protein phosphatase [Hyphomicrobiales bacterium]|nr:serine/threonine protein phosphatase [Hyphomicrobiales bacterium]
MRLGEAETPEGMRIYAIGDVHGCDTMLVDAHRAIADDLTSRPVKDHRIVHLGDYVDRGPASAAVIQRLADRVRSDPRTICLRGNHDTWLLDFLTDPHTNGRPWLTYGGAETMLSYGVNGASPNASARQLDRLSTRLSEQLPDADRSFLQACPLTTRFGDFFFCHAGIRPGVSLEEQAEDDLIWIREPFLSDRRDHGVVVVHGHTPVAQPDARVNRINIDTGAVFGGPMTVLALEGCAYRFLEIT